MFQERTLQGLPIGPFSSVSFAPPNDRDGIDAYCLEAEKQIGHADDMFWVCGTVKLPDGGVYLWLQRGQKAEPLRLPYNEKDDTVTLLDKVTVIPAQEAIVRFFVGNESIPFTATPTAIPTETFLPIVVSTSEKVSVGNTKADGSDLSFVLPAVGAIATAALVIWAESLVRKNKKAKMQKQNSWLRPDPSRRMKTKSMENGSNLV